MSAKNEKKCIVELNHKTIKLDGVQTSVFYLSNPQQRIVWRKELDGCMHPEGRICDWLVETADVNEDKNPKEPCIQVFVELKGHDWGHAGEQLENALKTYPPNRDSFRTRCYIVGTGFPAFQARGQKLISLFRQRYNVQLLTAKDGQTVPLEG